MSHQSKSSLFDRKVANQEETDYDSKTVMIAAERNDHILITDVVQKIDANIEIPADVIVIQRKEKYYGPELLVHAKINQKDYNYLITAPGPNSSLCLWAANTTEDNKRIGWFIAAEIEATLAAEQPPYKKCGQCGELIKTIHHDREAVIGNCSRV